MYYYYVNKNNKKIIVHTVKKMRPITTQQTQNICITKKIDSIFLGITSIQHQPNVCDVDPTLYTCYTNVVRSLGIANSTQ